MTERDIIKLFFYKRVSSLIEPRKLVESIYKYMLLLFLVYDATRDNTRA